MQYNILDFAPLANKHKNERCFIIGGGPSLRNEDLSLLDNEIVLACNKAFLATSLLNLSHYDYYFLTDPRVRTDIIKYNKKDFYNISVPRIYSYAIIKQKPIDVKEEFIMISKNYKVKFGDGKFPQNFSDGWGITGSVVFEACVVAYFMGFKEIYLLGVDMNYDNPNDTHFYKMGPREEKFKHDMIENWHNVTKTVDKLLIHFNNNDVKFINLSKGFVKKDLMPTDTLENILSNR